MIRRWLALTYYLYALRLAALSHFYFNPLYSRGGCLLSVCFQAAFGWIMRGQGRVLAVNRFAALS
nr:hypothetical protein [uncultured Kingella sp.]